MCPSFELAKGIPEFKDGKISSVMEAEDSIFIVIEEVSDKDFTAYLDEIKETFTTETYEMSTGDGMMYSATNDEGLGVMLTYEKDKGFSIAVSKPDPDED